MAAAKKKATKWPATEIVRRKVAELVPYARNAKTHPPKQVERIAAAIKEWGWTTPILIDAKGTVIAGHGRLLAAEKLEIDDVPCVVARGWTQKQKDAYRVADNQLAVSEWDADLLKVEIGGLGDFDLGLLGFDLKDLEGILETNGQVKEDEVPAVPKKAVSKLGDLWALGEHRVLCGDATKDDDVAVTLGGAKPFLMVTDPPYGVEYDPAWRTRAAEAGHLAYAAIRVGEVTNDDRADWGEAWDLFPGDVVYSWHPAGATSLVHAEAIERSGFVLRMQIIWAKSNFPIGRGDYHVRHEPCWYAVRKGAAARRTKDRTQTTLWEINLDKNVEGGHSTQKPLECMARPIRNHDAPQVYDPFLGSGTTLIAAEQLGRTCYGIEIEPRYVDVIIERWQNLTGKKATLEATGDTFEVTACKRKRRKK